MFSCQLNCLRISCWKCVSLFDRFFENLFCYLELKWLVLLKFSLELAKVVFTMKLLIAFSFYRNFVRVEIKRSIRMAVFEIVFVSLLFGRIVELVFVRSWKALLNSDIRPQPLHAGQQLLRKRLRVLHAGHHVHHHLGIALVKREKSWKFLERRHLEWRICLRHLEWRIC